MGFTLKSLHEARANLAEHDEIVGQVNAAFKFEEAELAARKRAFMAEQLVDAGSRDDLVAIVEGQTAGLLAAAVATLKPEKVGFKATATMDNGDVVPLKAGSRSVKIAPDDMAQVVNICSEFGRGSRLSAKFTLGQRDQFLADLRAAGTVPAEAAAFNFESIAVVKQGKNKLDC